jgi:hypothetical protein
MKRIIECFLLITCGISLCNAQQAISTAGGDATGADGTASYTFGQTDYTSLAGNAGIVMQGVQQPFEILVITGIEPNNEISLECKLYPNPTTDFLILKIQRERLENLSYQLMDMSGKILEIKAIQEVETHLSLLDFLSTTYFLKVIDNQKETITFKIIKN